MTLNSPGSGAIKIHFQVIRICKHYSPAAGFMNNKTFTHKFVSECQQILVKRQLFTTPCVLLGVGCRCFVSLLIICIHKCLCMQRLENLELVLLFKIYSVCL